jgi:hypothetical protein
MTDTTHWRNEESQMSDFSVRRMGVGVLLLAGAVLATGCEDKRVKALDTGISRDSALSVMGSGESPKSASDTLRNVYARDEYLIAGTKYEVLYFTPHDEKQGKDSIAWKKLTPIVLVNNKVVGRGWSYLDSLSTAHKIPLRKR